VSVESPRRRIWNGGEGVSIECRKQQWQGFGCGELVSRLAFAARVRVSVSGEGGRGGEGWMVRVPVPSVACGQRVGDKNLSVALITTREGG
jgi:hypothetical protein